MARWPRERRHRPRPGVPRRRSAGSPTRSPLRTPTTSTATRGSRSRPSTRCASRAPSRRSCPRSSAGAASRSRRSRPRASSSGAAAVRPRWSSRCTRSRSPASCGTSMGAPWFEAYLRDLASEQRLIASVTSEVGTGGDIGRSIAAVTPGERRPRHVREAGADRLVRRLRGRPPHDPAPDAGGGAGRPGRRADEQGPGHARTDRHLGPARHARHVLAGLRRACRVRRRPGPADAVPDGRDRVDGADLPHPLVAHLAGHRHRRVRSRARVRPCLGEAAARPGAADRRCASRT